MDIFLFSRFQIEVINAFGISPALLNGVQLTVELWQEHNLNTELLALGLQNRLNIHEVWLV